MKGSEKKTQRRGKEIKGVTDRGKEKKRGKFGNEQKNHAGPERNGRGS